MHVRSQTIRIKRKSCSHDNLGQSRQTLAFNENNAEEQTFLKRANAKGPRARYSCRLSQGISRRASERDATTRIGRASLRSGAYHLANGRINAKLTVKMDIEWALNRAFYHNTRASVGPSHQTAHTGPTQHTAHNTLGFNVASATRTTNFWSRDRLLRVVDESWTGRRRVCDQHLAAEGTRKIKQRRKLFARSPRFFCCD